MTAPTSPTTSPTLPSPAPAPASPTPDATALVAVVDVLVVKALESVGKATRGAWDVVPALLDNHGCPGVDPGRITTLLDAYVSQLATHGAPHRLGRLVTALRYVLPADALIRTPALNRASLEEIK